MPAIFWWLIWVFLHIYRLIGFRNRLIVLLDWAWSYVTFERGSRLITGLYARPIEDVKETMKMERHSRAS